MSLVLLRKMLLTGRQHLRVPKINDHLIAGLHNMHVRWRVVVRYMMKSSPASVHIVGIVLLGIITQHLRFVTVSLVAVAEFPGGL